MGCCSHKVVCDLFLELAESREHSVSCCDDCVGCSAESCQGRSSNTCEEVLPRLISTTILRSCACCDCWLTSCDRRVKFSLRCHVNGKPWVRVGATEHAASCANWRSASNGNSD